MTIIRYESVYAGAVPNLRFIGIKLVVVDGDLTISGGGAARELGPGEEYTIEIQDKVTFKTT